MKYSIVFVIFFSIFSNSLGGKKYSTQEHTKDANQTKLLENYYGLWQAYKYVLTDSYGLTPNQIKEYMDYENLVIITKDSALIYDYLSYNPGYELYKQNKYKYFTMEGLKVNAGLLNIAADSVTVLRIHFQDPKLQMDVVLYNNIILLDIEGVLFYLSKRKPISSSSSGARH